MATPDDKNKNAPKDASTIPPGKAPGADTIPPGKPKAGDTIPPGKPMDVVTPPPTGENGQVPGEQGQALYLRSLNEQLMGWDDPRAMLKRALKEDTFMLLCQKILSLKSGVRDAQCYEVLLRLKQEEDNLLPPGSFLDVAESLGMMAEIDYWVVRTLLAWGAEKMRANPAAQLPMMCVNVSAAVLVDDRFVKVVRRELQKTAYPPRALCFEISEHDVIEYHDNAQKFISALKPGCRITLDAFGSVKVSFSHLTGLAIDFLKIDGAIIQNIARDPAALAKARAITHASQRTGLRTIAECVEDKETLEKLREIGVDYAQGFGTARPEPLSKLP
jgi:EAL domain-containing protein (putative c-di-GMP-specific phosphodiesterase class I)